MRLNHSEIAGIKKAIVEFIPHENFQLFLFGSRIDESKKGGDIDLLLIVDESFKDDLLRQKHMLLAEIKDAIGDQKVDLIIATAQEITQDPFLESIQKTANRI
jgi:hypothetical protein